MSIITIENKFATYRVRDRTALDNKRWWIVERWSRDTQQWAYQCKFELRKQAVAFAERKLPDEQKYEEARHG